MIGSRRTAGSPEARTAPPADAPGVAALHRRARATYYPERLPDDGLDWPARRREAIERPDGQVPCAARGAGRAGIDSFRPPGGAGLRTVTGFRFQAGSGRRRTGIGAALHAACVALWRTSGHAEAVLEVHTGNRR